MYELALIPRLPGSEGKKKTQKKKTQKHGTPTQEVGTKVGLDQFGSLI